MAIQIPNTKQAPQVTGPRKEYTSLKMPEGAWSCDAEVELKEVKEVEVTRDNRKSTVACFVFTLLSVDARDKAKKPVEAFEGVEEVTYWLDPGNAYPETYFIRPMFELYLALQGKSLDQDAADKLHKRGADKVWAAFIDGKLNDASAKCMMRSRVKTKGANAGQIGTDTFWGPCDE